MIGLRDAQELHEALGAAIQLGDVDGLGRAREIAALLVSDLSENEGRQHLTATEMVDIADDALCQAYGELSSLLAFDADDFPPSALIACLMAHAATEGWDFNMACRVAREFGAASSTQIARGS